MAARPRWILQELAATPWTRLGAMAISALATAAALQRGDYRGGDHRAVWLAIATGAFAALLALEWRRPKLALGSVLAVGVATIAVAVLLPPAGSGDVWSYAMYGRIDRVHDASVYRSVPSDFPGDPVLDLVRPQWRNTPSVYGPVFTKISGLLAGWEGDPRGLALRFQLLAAGAVLLAVALLAVGARRAAAVAIVALNPLILTTVNIAHNDTLVGVAILGSVLLVGLQPASSAKPHLRCALAGAVLAVGALVKLSGLLPVAAVCLWLWRRQRRSDALAFGVVAVALTAAGYLGAGGAAFPDALRANGSLVTRGSLWALTTDGERLVLPGGLAVAVSILTVGIVLAVSAVASRARELSTAATAAVAAFLLCGAYVLPWYGAWALPVAGFHWRSRLTLAVLVPSSLLLLGYLGSDTAPDTSVQRWQRAALTVGVPLLVTAIAIAAAATALHGRRTASSAKALSPAA